MRLSILSSSLAALALSASLASAEFGGLRRRQFGGVQQSQPVYNNNFNSVVPGSGFVPNQNAGFGVRPPSSFVEAGAEHAGAEHTGAEHAGGAEAGAAEGGKKEEAAGAGEGAAKGAVREGLAGENGAEAGRAGEAGVREGAEAGAREGAEAGAREGAEKAEGKEGEGKEGEEGEEEEQLIEIILPVVFTGLALGCILQVALPFLPVYVRPPFTVALFICGMAMAAAAETKVLGLWGESILLVKNIEPDVILFLLLPPLLFESAFAIDFHVFKKVAVQSILLAFPGVAVSAFLTAFFLVTVAGQDFTFLTALITGSILAATDPVAVVSALSLLGAPPRLSILVEGESLLNDGSAFVMFLIVMDIAKGTPGADDAGHIILFFSQLAFGGPIFGIVAGFLVYSFIRVIFNDGVLEAGALILSSYVVFFVGDIAGVSAVLATVCFGLFMAYGGKYGLSPEVEEHHHAVLEQIGWFANVTVFVIAGILSFDFLEVAGVPSNWFTLIWLYAGLTIIRAVAILIMFPILTRLGYGFTLKDTALLVAAGLRGAVSLSLAVIIKATPASPLLTEQDKILIGFQVSGIVLATTIINGSLTEIVYKKLNIDIANPYYASMVMKVLGTLESQAEENTYGLKEDWFYAHADWRTVEAVVPDLSAVQVTGYDMDFPHSNKATDRRALGACAVFPGSSDFTSIAQNAKHDKSYDTTAHGRNRQSMMSDARSSTHRRKSKFGTDQSNYRLTMGPGMFVPMSPGGVLLPSSATGGQQLQTMTAEDIAQQIHSTFINAVKVHYHRQRAEGYMSPDALSILVDGANVAKEGPKQDEGKPGEVAGHLQAGWLAVKQSLQQLRTKKIPFLKRNGFVGDMVTNIEALSGFIHAHEIIVDEFRHEVGDKWVNLPVLEKQVQRVVSDARAELSNVANQYSFLVSAVRTVHVCRFLLYTKRDLAEELYERGLLDDKAKDAVVEKLEHKLHDLRDYLPPMRAEGAPAQGMDPSVLPR